VFDGAGADFGAFSLFEADESALDRFLAGQFWNLRIAFSDDRQPGKMEQVRLFYGWVDKDRSPQSISAQLLSYDLPKALEHGFSRMNPNAGLAIIGSED
jgi:hypothetical protein